MKVILEHELLGEQDVIPNRTPRHECCLSLIHKTRSMGLILLAKILVMTLYKMLQQEIGLNWDSDLE